MVKTMKNRITALFLTTALAISSMAITIPLSAASESGSDDIAVGTDLMEKVSTDAVVVDVEDGNGYLHLYDQYNDHHNPDTDGTLRWERDMTTAIGYQPSKSYDRWVNANDENEKFDWSGKTVYYVSLRARIANNWAARAYVERSRA